MAQLCQMRLNMATLRMYPVSRDAQSNARAHELRPRARGGQERSGRDGQRRGGRGWYGRYWSRRGGTGGGGTGG